MSTGADIVEHIYGMMQIDREWSIQKDSGFIWWGHRLPQYVSYGPERSDHGETITRVSAETKFICDLPDDPSLEGKIDALNAFASLNAYLYDKTARRITLVSSVYAHEQSASWIAPLFGCAAALQAAEAHIRADAMAQIFGGRPDTSAHPTSGARGVPDDMLNVIDSLFARVGQQPSPYSVQELREAQPLLDRLGAFGSVDSDGLTYELPFSDDTALLEVLPRMKHPQLGNGALLALKLPVSGDSPHALSHALNMTEASDQFTRCHALGAWCTKDGIPAYVSFLPAAAHSPGLLTNMVLSMAMRTRFHADLWEAA